MSNNKQSSVDWLVDKLFPKNDNIRFLCPKEILEQAKAMHKEEIIESYAIGSNDRLKNKINTDYYNETFGGEK